MLVGKHSASLPHVQSASMHHRASARLPVSAAARKAKDSVVLPQNRVFSCPEESTHYSACLQKLLQREAARTAGSKQLYVEAGSGDGLPVIYAVHDAIRSDCNSVTIRGFELNAQAADVARANIEQHGVGSVYSVSTGCVFEGVAAWPRASWLIANPPYLPAPDADIFMPELYGGQDGSTLTNRLLSLDVDGGALLMLSSISNPLRTIAHAQQLGYRLSDFSLCLLPFGVYSSEPKVFAHIRRMKAAGLAYFLEEADGVAAADSTSSPGAYLLAGAVFEKRRGVNGTEEDLSDALCKAMTALV